MRCPALRRLVVAAICAAEACGLPVAVRAQGKAVSPAEADVILPDCPVAALGLSALFAVLELELEHDGVRHISLVRSQRRDDVATIEVALACKPGAHQVLLRVGNPPYKEVHRAMDITDLPRRLRARAVAIAAAELARSTWSNAPLADEVGDAPPPDADVVESAEPVSGSPRSETTGESTEADARPPPAPRTATAQPIAKLPDKVGDPSPQGRSKRRRLDFAAGPEARWFLSARSPAFGGRAATRIGRFQAGADVLYTYDPRFAAPSKLGLAAGWAAFDLVVRESGIWRLSTSPRIAAGAGWARVQASSQGSSLLVPPDVYPSAPADATAGLYVEGSLVAALSARTGSGWLFVLGLEAGLGWGIAPGCDSLQPGVRSSFGAILLVEHPFREVR